MNLNLVRKVFTDNSTIGILYVDELFFCYTLEDTVRPVKIQNETAIPSGTYEVVLDWSDKFKRVMPHLLNVPNFSGVRIHGGNTKEDTAGCILVGGFKMTDFIGDSRVTFIKLFSRLEQATDKIIIEILDGHTEESYSG